MTSQTNNQSPVLDLHLTNLHFEDQGSGPAILLIHGLGAQSNRWRNNLGPLAKKHRVIAIDLPGFGRSNKTSITQRGSNIVKLLIKLLKKLKINKVSLIGNSMGGWIAMLLTQKYPQIVDKLILVAPAFYQGLPKNLTAEQISQAANPKTLTEMKLYFEKVLHVQPTDADTLAKALEQQSHDNKGSAIVELVNSLARNEDILSNEQISSFHKQTLVIHGASDGIVPINASLKLVNSLPDAVFKEIEQAGHWPQLEQASMFNQIVLKYLEY